MSSTLLAEFRDALPHVHRLRVLEAHLLQQGWTVRTRNLPAPLEGYLDLVQLMLRMDTKLRAINALAKTTADGELWIMLQQLSLRTLYQNMVAFYDFGATVPIDPESVTALIGIPPRSVRGDGDRLAEASWERPGEPGAPLALMVNLAFARPGEQMPGVRIVASAHGTEPDERPGA